MPDRTDHDLFTRGDYSFWSNLFGPVSEDLASAAGIAPGDRVLDVAAGDGNTALAAAKLGADVTAVDLSPSQIDRGRRRAAKEHAPIRWVRGRGEDLPFKAAAFDHALDTFGDVLGERTRNAALIEMARVVRARGVVGLTTWTGEGFGGAWAQLERQFVGDTEAMNDQPIEREARVRDAITPVAETIDISRRVLPLRWESADAFTDAMLEQDPYLHDLRAKMLSKRWPEFAREIRRLVHAWNTARDGSLHVEMPYLRVIART